MRPPLPDNSARLKLILHGLFLISGTVTVLIGQVLPILARHYSLSDLQLSFYFPAQFAGSLAGTFLTSRYARKNQFLLASIIGAVLMAAGLLLMNVDSFGVSLFAFGLNGVGIGLTLPAINMTVLELSPLNTASALSFLNFFWGVGAIICKPFVDLSSGGNDILPTTLILCVPMLIAASMLYFQPTRIIETGTDNSGAEDSGTPIWSLPLAWVIALFNFIHVGFESGMGGWLTTYTERVDSTQIGQWVSPTLVYFLLFVIGRGVAPLMFRFLNENKMLLLGLFVVLAGMMTTVTAVSVLTLGIGAAIAGFGTSWIFPTNVARFSKTFGPEASRRATPLFICGTLGAASSTWLIGFVSDRTGDLRSGMYVLVGCIVLLIGVQAVIGTRRRVEA